MCESIVTANRILINNPGKWQVYSISNMAAVGSANGLPNSVYVVSACALLRGHERIAYTSNT